MYFTLLGLMGFSKKLHTIEKVSEYDQEIPQSHTVHQRTAPRGIVTEHL